MTVAGSNGGVIAQLSQMKLTFTDDSNWRSKITSIVTSVPGWLDEEFIYNNNLQITPGIIVGPDSGPPYFYALGQWTWTIKATGYQDTIVTVTVQ